MGWIKGLIAAPKIAAAKILEKFGIPHELTKDKQTGNISLKVRGVPDNVEKLEIKEGNTPTETAYVAKSVVRPDEAPLIELSDAVLQSPKGSLPKPTNAYDDLKEPREIAYYPAGKNPYGRGNEGGKPNIEAIRQWVSNTKVATSSNFILSEEFGKKSGMIYGKSGKELENAIDEVTYKVARKIWYVGRKPRYMSDDDWQEDTKDMRPAEGSFSKNEDWGGKFPYGETYKYDSGKFL
jgi:hypothetical protein